MSRATNGPRSDPCDDLRRDNGSDPLRYERRTRVRTQRNIRPDRRRRPGRADGSSRASPPRNRRRRHRSPAHTRALREGRGHPATNARSVGCDGSGAARPRPLDTDARADRVRQRSRGDAPRPRTPRRRAVPVHVYAAVRHRTRSATSLGRTRHGGTPRCRAHRLRAEHRRRHRDSPRWRRDDATHRPIPRRLRRRTQRRPQRPGSVVRGRPRSPRSTCSPTSNWTGRCHRGTECAR